eukprot:3942613-Amphidinium_carterae.2
MQCGQALLSWLASLSCSEHHRPEHRVALTSPGLSLDSSHTVCNDHGCVSAGMLLVILVSCRAR